MRIIAGALGGRNLKTVEGPGYRPATAKVREAIFSMLSSRGVVWSLSLIHILLGTSQHEGIGFGHLPDQHLYWFRFGITTIGIVKRNIGEIGDLEVYRRCV